MGDLKKSTGNPTNKIPSFFGDISHSEQDIQACIASDGDERERNYRHTTINSDSFSDDEVGMLKVTDWQREDTEQQFWGDNELESTSHSDNDSSVSHHYSHNEEYPQRSTFCTRYERAPKNRKSNSMRKRQKGLKQKSFLSTEIGKLVSSSLNNSTDKLFKEKSVTGRPPKHNGVPRARFYVKNRSFKRRQRRRNVIVASSSSTESDSSRDPTCISGKAIIYPEETLPSRQMSQPSTSTSRTTELCPICQLRPKNGIVVHGQIGHQCYCYYCTMKLWRAHANCPVCQRKIREVIKNVIP